jgi:hypothetical protein
LSRAVDESASAAGASFFERRVWSARQHRSGVVCTSGGDNANGEERQVDRWSTNDVCHRRVRFSLDDLARCTELVVAIGAPISREAR